MSTAIDPQPPPGASAGSLRSQPGTPTWEIARWYPVQGEWTEQQYFDLERKKVEFTDGVLEFLPMPSVPHQVIARFLFLALHGFVTTHELGQVHFTGTRVRIREGKYREPDVVYASNDRRIEHHFIDCADLVVEILSEGAENRARDLHQKRVDYAEAKIPEYWVVDPQSRTITVLVLDGDAYAVHGEFRGSQSATSRVLSSFAVAIDECFADV